MEPDIVSLQLVALPAHLKLPVYQFCPLIVFIDKLQAVLDKSMQLFRDNLQIQHASILQQEG
jgi:hypothetical protein